jgi:hypothetical protein
MELLKKEKTKGVLSSKASTEKQLWYKLATGPNQLG